MSTPEDRDLADAFEELTAPPSTANYATRTPGLEIRTSSRRWPQVLATALAVVVAAGGATTFLALRSARQGGPSTSVGSPPARSGAAMAYDSTAGVTVMFGGAAGSGQGLTDTWTWDGSAWTAAAAGPGALVGTRMVDDPADGGVLLVGAPAPPLGDNAVVGSACSGGGTANPGSTSGTGGTPVASIGASPGGDGSTTTGAPAIASAPSTGLPTPNSPAPTDVGGTCPPVAPAPAVQTWLFNSSGWHRAAPGSTGATPPAGVELAFDPSTRQVVAVSPAGFSCGPPLLRAVRSGAAIACPVAGGAAPASEPSAVPCGVPVGCLPAATVATWTWADGSWRRAAADAGVQLSGTTLLLNDPAVQHAVLLTESGLGGYEYPLTACAPSQACPPAQAPLVTTWTWSGSGWVRRSQVQAPQQQPALGGATEATIGGHVIVLTAAGDTWTRAAGQWTQDLASRHPSARTGAAMAEGPGGTTVLFGGASSSGVFVGAAGQSVGSDTWLWNGNTWQQRGGTAPSPPPSPTNFACGATGKAVIPPCVAPQPAQVAPAAPVTPQASVPHAHNTPIGQATP